GSDDDVIHRETTMRCSYRPAPNAMPRLMTNNQRRTIDALLDIVFSLAEAPQFVVACCRLEIGTRRHRPYPTTAATVPIPSGTHADARSRPSAVTTVAPTMMHRRPPAAATMRS